MRVVVEIRNGKVVGVYANTPGTVEILYDVDGTNISQEEYDNLAKMAGSAPYDLMNDPVPSDKNTLAELHRESRTRNQIIAEKAFAVLDWVQAMESGGINGMKELVSSEELADGTVAVRWKFPEACGLSDRIYHYNDDSIHTDVYSCNDGRLLINNEDPFWDFDNLLEESQEEVKTFCNEYGIKLEK